MSENTLIRRSKTVSITAALPITLAPKERKGCTRICPVRKCYVTTFSCLQCSSFEIDKEEKRRARTGKTGECLYPKKASPRSQKITCWNPYGEFAEKKDQGSPRGNEVNDKIAFAESLVNAKKERKAAIAEIMKHFPKMKNTYASAIYQRAKRKLKGK